MCSTMVQVRTAKKNCHRFPKTAEKIIIFFAAVHTLILVVILSKNNKTVRYRSWSFQLENYVKFCIFTINSLRAALPISPLGSWCMMHVCVTKGNSPANVISKDAWIQKNSIHLHPLPHLSFRLIASTRSSLKAPERTDYFR